MPDPTRRALLSLSLIKLVDLDHPPLLVPIQAGRLAPAHNPATSPLTPADGAIFSARSGVNVVPLGFAVYQPVSVTSWDAAMTEKRLTALQMAGFDHIRIAFDPTPALAATDLAALDGVLDVARHAIDATLRAGFKAILDLHVATSGDWNTSAIEADYPAKPKWLRYLDIARGFARLCANYPTAQLALEPYNENSNNESYGNSGWADRSKSLWNAIRAANLKTTLLMGGSFYSSIEGLQDLKASAYDANTGFVVHNYNPTIFTHQNAASYTRFVERLHYPPIASDHAEAITGMTMRVKASSLSDAEKAAILRDRTRRLDTYFTVPQGPDYIAAKVQEIVDWQRRNSVPSSRIFVTEFGSHNDHDFRGASLTSRMAWVQDIDRAHEAAGFCRTIWTYNSPDYWDITAEDGSWRVRNGFLIALGRTAPPDDTDEAAALFKPQTREASPATKALINATIRLLKNDQVWDKLHVLYVFAGKDLAEAQIDWKTGQPARLDAVTLKFVANHGVANALHQAGSINVPAISVDVAASPDGNHVGLFLVGPGEQHVSIADQAGAPLLTIDSSSVALRSGARTSRPNPAQSESHVLLSQTADTIALYLDGSATNPQGGINPSIRSEPATLRLEPSNQAVCAVLHAGASLTADDAKAIYTILRFYINGVRRMSAAPDRPQ